MRRADCIKKILY